MAARPTPLLVRHSTANRHASGDDQSMTVVSANLGHDWPFHRKLTQRLQSFAGLVEEAGADVLLVQEVARQSDLQVDDWLARRLGMNYVYARGNGHEHAIGFEEGLAIFSHFPIGQVRHTTLQPSWRLFVRRRALAAQLHTRNGKIWAFCTHLSLLPGRNAAQVDHLSAWVDLVSGAHAAIIGGDFNAHEDSAQMWQAGARWIDAFRQVNPHAEGFTHELGFSPGAPLMKQRLDYVFLKPQCQTWRVLEARHLEAKGELKHSDHRAVLARIAPGASGGQ